MSWVVCSTSNTSGKLFLTNSFKDIARDQNHIISKLDLESKRLILIFT